MATTKTENDAIGWSGSTSDNYKQGPFRLLYDAVHQPQCQILVQCRNDRNVFGNLVAFDHHFNLVMTNAQEVRLLASGEGHQTRFLGKILLRGDGITLITRVPES